MTRQNLAASKTDVSKITISTWVYIPKEAVEAQNKIVDGDTLDPRFASKSVRRRIPIMEFGNSIEPRVGIGVDMSMTWEGYLGFFWWIALISPPDPFLGYTCSFWIGSEATTRTPWFAWSGGKAYNSVSYDSMWKGWVNNVFLGTAAIGVGTALYRQIPGGDSGTETSHIPVVNYNNFDDTGIKEFSVNNDGPRGPYWARYIGGGPPFAEPMSFVWSGQLRVFQVFDHSRVAVIEGDVAEESRIVESEIFWTGDGFWDAPLWYTIQPTPSPEPLREPTGGTTGKYFAYGTLVIVFPERPNVTYGKPAIPSTLYYSGGSVTFLLTSRWTEDTVASDQELMPTVSFTAGGFKLDSWNHIFLTIDLTTMQLRGGQDDKELTTVVDTAIGPVRVRVPLTPPYMAVPPKFSMLVNGKLSKSAPEAKLTTFSSKDVKWSKGGGGGGPSYFPMSLGTLAGGGSGADSQGQIGFPIIPQEKGRWKTTGPNQDIKYAYTHIWFDKYIEPTAKNMNKFFWKSKNKNYNFVIPPADKKAAVKAFGKPDVWFYRDKEGDVEWKNLGSAGSFSNTGTKPKDFRPGPGQPKRQKKTTT